MSLDQELKRERAARARLTAEGFRLEKTRPGHWSRKEYGVGYQISQNNMVVAGCCHREFELSLNEVEAFVTAIDDDRSGPAPELLRFGFEAQAENRRAWARKFPRDTRYSDAIDLLVHLAKTVELVKDDLLLAYMELFDDCTASERSSDLLNSVGMTYFPADATEFVKDFIAASTVRAA